MSEHLVGTRAGWVTDGDTQYSHGFGGDHYLAPARSADAPVDGAAGRYGRLFPELPALTADEGALLALGAAGGSAPAAAESSPRS